MTAWDAVAQRLPKGKTGCPHGGGGMDAHTNRRAIALWALRAGFAAVLLGVVAFSLVTASMPTAEVETPPPGIVVGVPGGAVISAPPSQTATPSPIVTASPEPSMASPAPASPPPATPAPTGTPVAPIAAPSVAPPPATVPSTPVPTPAIVVAVADSPDAAVAAFYRDVVAGDFDAAYARWSDRMKATYPREGNLDERFDQTADITFSDLFTVERTGTTAVVQANFTETYDSGGSRAFIGYWRLILVDGRWLLDEPHY